MITLIRHTIPEIGEDYPPIFVSVFKEWKDEGNCPSMIYYGYEDEKFIGFVAGYPMSSNLWYIQRTGYITDEQHKTKNISRTREVMEVLHGDWPYLLTLVCNDDIPMLKMSLTVGFKVIGTRMDTNKDLWVEMLKEKNHG